MDNFELRAPGSVEPPKRKRGWAAVKAYLSNPKKRIFLYSLIGLILITGVGYYLFLRNTDQKIGEDIKIKESHQTEMTYEAPLDGVKTTLEASQRHPLGIMIENHPEARPQAGLSKASVLYEAMAEGGITRFLAIFGTNEAEKVGPIRSARPYYVDWILGYNGYYSHVGGNATALDQIKTDKVLDLNQFAYPGPYYRDRSLKVSSEHTMFSSTPKLREQAEKNGYTKENNFKVYTFKDDPKNDSPEYQALPESQSVVVDYSSAGYKVTFDYDKTTNSYKRLQAGVAHKDRTTGEQLNPKNIVVMTVNRTPHTTRINEHGYLMTTVGQGKAVMIMDGKTIVGTWKKNAKTNREVFLNEIGEEVTFNRGQLMICVIAPESTLTVDGAKI